MTIEKTPRPPDDPENGIFWGPWHPEHGWLRSHGPIIPVEPEPDHVWLKRLAEEHVHANGQSAGSPARA